MPEVTFTVLATLAAQAVGAGVLALLLYGFYRQYGKSYLLHWAYSWVALSVHHLASTAGLWFMASRIPATDPRRLAIALTGSVAGYLQVVWLLFGVWEVVRRRPARI